jgi:hypothetical protein
MTDNCTRCKGTGFFASNAGVMYHGVPGLCYGCNGVGTLAGQKAVKLAAKACKQAEIDYKPALLEAEKIKAQAAYDACEMGYISERKRDRRIASAILECVSAGCTREEFAAHRVADDVAVKLATEDYNPERKAA